MSGAFLSSASDKARRVPFPAGLFLARGARLPSGSSVELLMVVPALLRQVDLTHSF
jgi:hypothetical protein